MLSLTASFTFLYPFRARVAQYSVQLRTGALIPRGAKDFSCNLCVQTGSGTHPTPEQLVPGSFPRRGSAADA
jgi:hypothetical protein